MEVYEVSETEDNADESGEPMAKLILMEDSSCKSSNSRGSSLSLIINDEFCNNVNDINGYSNSESNEILNEQFADEPFQIVKERQKTFEKITRTMERNTAKWKRLHEYVELIDMNDNSHFQLISERIKEVKSMCSSLIRPEYILDLLKPEVKELALNFIPISRNDFEDSYRKEWKKLDFFRFAVRMARTYSLLSVSHLKYPWWEQSQKRNVRRSIRIPKHSINLTLRLCLTTNPKYRNQDTIKQIIWFNKAIGAFTDFFPVEMENELARYLSYEIYDEDRVIRCQGDVPHKLYYILAGKIELVKVYRLSQGEVHKSMGFLSHKQISDFESFDAGFPSTTYMVARGHLEVLTLHREDYITLSNQTNLDTIRDFLFQIEIFKDLPINSLALQSKLVKIQYFKQEKVITRDSKKAIYLYIVKSGKVSVARRQTILNEDFGSLFKSSDEQTIGCKRDGKHASAMLGLTHRQKTFKLMQNDSSRSKELSRKEKIEVGKPHTTIEKFVADDDESFVTPDSIVRSQTLFDMKSTKYNKDKDDEGEVMKIISGVNVKSKQERETYVKLDSLKSMDIFGLESVEDIIGLPQSTLILISEGAEVIMINKRYFLDNVNNNTLLEIRKLIKSYITEDEAKMIIDEETKWQAYKSVLMRRMISKHCF